MTTVKNEEYKKIITRLELDLYEEINAINDNLYSIKETIEYTIKRLRKFGDKQAALKILKNKKLPEIPSDL